jgi:spermidine/putrescine transport system permease protein
MARVTRLFRSAPAYPLLLPGMVWLAIFFFVPMYYLLDMSLRTGNLLDGFNQVYRFANYGDAIRENKEQFTRSIVYAASATALAFCISYPLAYVIAFRGGRYKNFLLMLVIAPFFTNYLIRTLAWETILADHGIVTSAFRSLGILTATDKLGFTSGQRLLATPLAVVTGITYNYLPFMTLPLYVSLEKIDPRLLEASLDLYATRVRAFLKVTLPLSLPGVFAGVLMTFVPMTADYVNAGILGGPQNTMIGNIIQTKYLVNNDYPTAAALSFTLMAAMLIGIFAYAKALGTENVLEAAAR